MLTKDELAMARASAKENIPFFLDGKSVIDHIDYLEHEKDVLLDLVKYAPNPLILDFPELVSEYTRWYTGKRAIIISAMQEIEQKG